MTKFAATKMVITNAAGGPPVRTETRLRGTRLPRTAAGPPPAQTAAERLAAQAVEQGHPHRVADATTLRSIASLLGGMR